VGSNFRETVVSQSRLKTGGRVWYRIGQGGPPVVVIDSEAPHIMTSQELADRFSVVAVAPTLVTVFSLVSLGALSASYPVYPRGLQSDQKKTSCL
jgi:hypothetical protein